jgi:formate hydrogenlyase subunit 6/NADH:ubiquinone oxidoreductase subunit I
MDTTLTPVEASAAIELPALDQLIASLRRRGYEVIGPKREDGAITCGAVEGISDLPTGWTDEQQAGQYRLKERGDGTVFGYGVGPHSWKRFLHPPEVRIFAAEREETSFRVLNETEAAPPRALLGVRPCEIEAIRIQDRVLLGDRYTDAVYEERRERVFLVAVNCTAPSGTCFCTSLGTGPQARNGFDLALTEVVGENRHVFLVQAGTGAGEEVLAGIDRREPSPAEVRAAANALAAAAARIVRKVDTADLPRLLYGNFEHPEWDRVAARCLSCGNCTQVCPTCFCSTVEDASDPGGMRAERWRKWDSCFTEAFSYIHGGSVRLSVKSRYRQWLTHKFAAWVDQFGTFGCVGCGRCITWCPARIDITEEIAAIRGTGFQNGLGERIDGSENDD